jgi:plastocyanin
MRLTRARAALAGVGAALLLLAGAGPAVRAQDTAVVSMDLLVYQPAAISVPAGTTVTWVNNSVLAHTVTAIDGAWDSGQFGQGESWSAQFPEPGIYPYYCNLPGHELMKGVVEVTP